MIEQTLMALNRWELKFRDGIELQKKRTPDFWDHVCITPTRLVDAAITATTVKAQARFTGRIDEINFAGTRSIAGPSALVWLGDAEGKGSFQHGGSGGPYNVSFATFIAGLFSASTNVNAITTASLPTVDTSAINDQIAATEAARPAIERWRETTSTEVEFYLDPAGQMHWGEFGLSTIFRTDPQVILMPNGVGWDGTYYSASSQISYRKRIDKYATDVTCTGQAPEGSSTAGTGSASTIFTRPKAFDGSTNAHIEAAVTSGSTADADCAKVAANALLFSFTTNWEFTVSADMEDPGRWIRVGDYVYLYDPSIDLYNNAVHVDHAGRPMNPVKLRCLGMRWPVTAGMGVYLIRSAAGSNAVVDMTDWIEPETGPVTLDVETRPRALPSVGNGSPHFDGTGSAGSATKVWCQAPVGYTISASDTTPAVVGPITVDLGAGHGRCSAEMKISNTSGSTRNVTFSGAWKVDSTDLDQSVDINFANFTAGAVDTRYHRCDIDATGTVDISFVIVNLSAGSDLEISVGIEVMSLDLQTNPCCTTGGGGA